MLCSFISEGTAVWISPYALFRDPRYFSPSPERFWPDRWLRTANPNYQRNEKSEGTPSIDFITTASSFIPFSLGPANCAGKNLALVEMRMVVAVLVQRFDMTLAEGYDPDKWTDELNDWLVMSTGNLPVTLTPRLL